MNNQIQLLFEIFCYFKYFSFYFDDVRSSSFNIWRNFCVQMLRVNLRNFSTVPITVTFAYYPRIWNSSTYDFSNIRLNILDITDLTLITTGTWAFFLFRRRCVVKTNSWWQNNKAVVFYSSPTFFHLNNDI